MGCPPRSAQYPHDWHSARPRRTVLTLPHSIRQANRSHDETKAEEAPLLAKPEGDADHSLPEPRPLGTLLLTVVRSPTYIREAGALVLS